MYCFYYVHPLSSLRQLLDTLVAVPARHVLEPLHTLGAGVGQLPGVHPRVAHKLLPLSETGATVLTLKKVLHYYRSLSSNLLIKQGT